MADIAFHLVLSQGKKGQHEKHGIEFKRWGGGRGIIELFGAFRLGHLLFQHTEIYFTNIQNIKTWNLVRWVKSCMAIWMNGSTRKRVVQGSVSQTEFRGTSGCRRTPFGVPKEIVQQIRNYFQQPVAPTNSSPLSPPPSPDSQQCPAPRQRPSGDHRVTCGLYLPVDPE